MKNKDIVYALHALARKGLLENHQQRELLKAAANRITEQEIQIRRLEEDLQKATQMTLE